MAENQATATALPKKIDAAGKFRAEDAALAGSFLYLRYGAGAPYVIFRLVAPRRRRRQKSCRAVPVSWRGRSGISRDTLAFGQAPHEIALRAIQPLRRPDASINYSAILAQGERMPS